MADFDPQAFYEEFSIDTRLDNAPSVEPAQPLPILSPFAERLRDDLLRDLSRSRASLEMLEATLRDRPSDDVSFDAIDKAFGDSLAACRASFERFRGHRECAGEA